MIKIEYTFEGMKITHPTGVVQILSVEHLTRLKNSQENRKAKITQDITRYNSHITEANKVAI